MDVVTCGDPLDEESKGCGQNRLYCPMAGRVVDVNTELIEHPEIVNSDPHATWMLVLELAVPEQIAGLLDAAAYSALVV